LRAGPASDPDRYTLGRVVGAGTEGVLYRATITTSSGTVLDVAVKMLHARYLARIETWRRRWEEQVELLRSLHAPGVVPVRDGLVGPLPHRAGDTITGELTLYLVMNWVDGVRLDDWAQAHPDDSP